MSVTQNITGKRTDMINPFAFILSLRHHLVILRFPIPSFCQIEDTLFLKSKELGLSFTSIWVLQKNEVFRKEAST